MLETRCVDCKKCASICLCHWKGGVREAIGGLCCWNKVGCPIWYFIYLCLPHASCLPSLSSLFVSRMLYDLGTRNLLWLDHHTDPLVLAFLYYSTCNWTLLDCSQHHRACRLGGEEWGNFPPPALSVSLSTHLTTSLKPSHPLSPSCLCCKGRRSIVVPSPLIVESPPPRSSSSPPSTLQPIGTSIATYVSPSSAHCSIFYACSYTD